MDPVKTRHSSARSNGRSRSIRRRSFWSACARASPTSQRRRVDSGGCLRLWRRRRQRRPWYWRCGWFRRRARRRLRLFWRRSRLDPPLSCPLSSAGTSRVRLPPTPLRGFGRTSQRGHDPYRKSDARTAEPLFDARETTALQRLIADVRDARVDLTPLAKEGPMPLPAMDPLVISPIVIEPLDSSGIEGERP